MYPYYYYNPIMSALPIAILVAIILGVALYFTFLRKENENKYTGWKKTVYDFFNFNKFYTEDIMKLLYVMLTAAFTVLGVFMLFVKVSTGVILLIVGNVVLRVSYEMVMMFVILCRKTVSIDRKMDRVVAFYGDDFDDGQCDSEDEDEEGDILKFFCGGDCSGCSVEGCEGPAEEEIEEAQQEETEEQQENIEE